MEGSVLKAWLKSRLVLIIIETQDMPLFHSYLRACLQRVWQLKLHLSEQSPRLLVARALFKQSLTAVNIKKITEHNKLLQRRLKRTRYNM
ncbi:hypothetical protein N836_17615 [Leptolyngbya sp. Heron Island J]|nr:hypothetical protein N836_17615 [Leptolyngbya sp. Heron Island J]